MSKGPCSIFPFQFGPPTGPKPKCHLPITAVLYPAFEKIVATVCWPAGIKAEASPVATPVSFLRKAYSPFSKEYREGVQVAEVVCAWVNSKPFRANWSMLGVLMVFEP